VIVSIFEPQKITKGDRAGSVVPGWVPTRWETTWSDFVDVLRDTTAMEADPADKASVTSFSCAEFAPGFNRSKAGVLGCDLIGFDFDDKTGDTPGAWRFEALETFMEQAGVPFAIHTTASCKSNAHCLRLLMPLDRRVGPAEYPQVWRAFAKWLGNVADEATKDASRLFFEPRRWKGRYNRYHAGHTDSAPIAVDKIAATFRPLMTDPIALPAARSAIQTLSTTHDGMTIANISDLDLSPIVSAEALTAALTARQGGRMFRFLCSVASRARWRSIRLTEVELATIGEELARRMGRRNTSDIRRDAVNALRFAERATMPAGTAPSTVELSTLPRYW
jgi:hypothetical protein